MGVEPLLSVHGLFAGYGEADVLRGIDLSVNPGEIVAVLGSNGVGKSTLNRALSGVVRARAGSIRFDGEAIERAKPAEIVGCGLIHVPEGRRIFPNLSVRENLDLGSYRRGGQRRADNRERVFATFPRLFERQSQAAGTLSGGEQQMLAIGRGMMAEPKLIILDEPSLGLSPILVEELFGLIKRINSGGVSVLLVEQNAKRALESSDDGIVLELGRMRIQDRADKILADPRMLHAKAVLVDDEVAVLGSANVDMRSLLLNYEVALFVTSAPELHAVARWMEGIMHTAHPRHLPNGGLAELSEGLARLLAPQL